MITASKLAIAIAVASPLAAATVGESFATPVPSRAVAVKAAAPAAATEVRYWANGPYAYGPYGGYTYPYGGYTYWYPTYPYWDSNTWNTGNGYY